MSRLNKYIPSKVRSSAHAEVYLTETKTHGGKQCECEVVVHLPKESIRIKESTINMFAAVDIVEEKLKLALKKYKDLHQGGRKERHLLGRVRFQF